MGRVEKLVPKVERERERERVCVCMLQGLPGGGRGFKVRGVGGKEGRSTYYYYLLLHKVGCK